MHMRLCGGSCDVAAGQVGHGRANHTTQDICVVLGISRCCATGSAHDVVKGIGRTLATNGIDKQVERRSVIQGVMHTQAQDTVVQDKTHGRARFDTRKYIISHLVARFLRAASIDHGFNGRKRLEDVHFETRIGTEHGTVNGVVRQRIAPLPQNLPAICVRCQVQAHMMDVESLRWRCQRLGQCGTLQWQRRLTCLHFPHLGMLTS